MTEPEDLACPRRLLALLILGSASDDFESLQDIKASIDRIVLANQLTILDQPIENELRWLVQEGLLSAFQYDLTSQRFLLLDQSAELTDLSSLYFLISKAGHFAMDSREVSDALDALNLWS